MADARRHGSSDAFEAIGAALRDLAAGRPEITVLASRPVASGNRCRRASPDDRATHSAWLDDCAARPTGSGALRGASGR
ncbi:MAG TPA: hypothetical protein VEZ42_11800 [Pseudonocardia sp.]|nr:hypothetical protein [Pseudonocardia sp.]